MSKVLDFFSYNIRFAKFFTIISLTTFVAFIVLSGKPLDNSNIKYWWFYVISIISVSLCFIRIIARFILNRKVTRRI